MTTNYTSICKFPKGRPYTISSSEEAREYFERPFEVRCFCGATKTAPPVYLEQSAWTLGKDEVCPTLDAAHTDARARVMFADADAVLARFEENGCEAPF